MQYTYKWQSNTNIEAHSSLKTFEKLKVCIAEITEDFVWSTPSLALS